MDRTVLWPWGEADVKNLAAAANIPATIENSMTILTIAILTANSTLNLIVNPDVPVGSQLLVKWSTTATETLAFGTGIDSATVTGVAGKNRSQGFVYDGVSFKPTGANVQLD
jgi:hypothetical protein